MGTIKKPKDTTTSTPATLGNKQLSAPITPTSKNGVSIGNSAEIQNYANDINTVNNLKSNNLGKQAVNAGGTTNNTNSVLGALKGVGNVFKNGIGQYAKNVATDIVNTIKDNITGKYQQYISGGSSPETQGSTTATAQSNNDAYWKDLQNQIKMNTLNSKNEVAMAQRKASANMENYLKMLGIQGTGLGQSQYTQLASDYANKIADINNNEQQALLDLEAEQKAETKEYQKQRVNDAISLIENNGDASVIIAELESQGYDTTFLKEYSKTIADDFAKDENDKQISNIMTKAETMISYGQDPSSLIAQLVELGASQADIDYINSLYNAYKEEKETTEADELKISNEELYNKSTEIYSYLKENYNTFSDEEKRVIDKFSIALANKDYESLDELLDKVTNIGLGFGELNNEIPNNSTIETAYQNMINAEEVLKKASGFSERNKALAEFAKAKREYEKLINQTPIKSTQKELLPDGSFYTDEITEEDFGDYTGSGKSNKKQSKAINRLIEDSKEWSKTGENDGLIVNANYGNGVIHLFKFDAKNGTWTDLGDEKWQKYKGEFVSLEELYPNIKNG